MAYSPYNAVNAIYKLKGQWDSANKSGDETKKNEAAQKAQSYYNELRRNGYGSVADELTASDYAAAKSINDYYAKTGRTATRPYFYTLGKSRGLSESDIDKLIGWDNTTGEITFGGKNIGKPDSVVDGTSYWSDTSVLDNAFNDYVDKTGLTRSTYIIDAVYKALNRLGFEGGNVLEPSMGIGNFFAKMPKKVMEASKLFGVEIDGVSGRIASYLYPDAQITIDGFQNTAYKDGSFDLVVGNVPFGDVKYSYKGKKYLIHDFFFRKSLDKVADGGLMVFITSKGTMDKADYSLRAELASQADLVAAYRLPSSVFDRSAGASVATDIIILQKKENGSTNGVNFKNVGEIDGIAINEYFVEHPENIIGELTLRTNQFGKPVSTVKATGDVSAMLTKAMNKLPKGLLNGVSTTGTVDVTDYTGTTQHYTENGKNVEFVDSVTVETIWFVSSMRNLIHIEVWIFQSLLNTLHSMVCPKHSN